MNDPHLPYVSVIVPVFNDGQRLGICLEALEHQTYSEDLYSVVVVDNGSDDAHAIKKIVTNFNRFRYEHESLPGSYAARNKGVSVAKGDIIAFTDADCIPAQDWIEHGVKALLETPNCGLVAGKIENVFSDPQNLTAVELYESIMAFPQREFLEKYRYGATANVFTFRSVIETVGGFNASLKSSGDVEWGQRVFSYGYRQLYGERVCVAHPARASFRQLYSRTVRHAGGRYDLEQSTQYSFACRQCVFISNSIQNLIPPIRFVIKTFRDPRLNGLGQKIKVSFLFLCVRYITALERVRLKFGGISTRE